MKKEIAKKQKILIVRNGIEVWLDEEKWEKLEMAVDNNIGQFYEIEGRRINKVDLTGIFLPEDIENLKRRKNGQWQCKYGKWHNRGEECICYKKKDSDELNRKLQAEMAGGNVSEEERIKNLKKFRATKEKIFNSN